MTGQVDIAYGVDEHGRPRMSVLIATVADVVIGSAAHVRGSDRWVVIPAGGPRTARTPYALVESEVAARAALLAQAQNGQRS